MPNVIVCQDAQDYRVVEFASSVTIGRESDNDIVLASPQVSRHHASIALRENGEYMLFDHESTNGVWIEERKVSGIRLLHGMTFRIFNYFFTFIDERKDDRPSRVFAIEDNNPPAAAATDGLSHHSLQPGIGRNAIFRGSIGRTRDGRVADSPAFPFTPGAAGD